MPGRVMDKKQTMELTRLHLEAAESECRWCFAIDLERVKGEIAAQYDFPDATLLHLECPRCLGEWSNYYIIFGGEYLEARICKLHPELKGKIGEEQMSDVAGLAAHPELELIDEDILKAHLEAGEFECRWCFAVDMERVPGKIIKKYRFPDATLHHLACPRCEGEWTEYTPATDAGYLKRRIFKLHPELKDNLGYDRFKEIVDLLWPKHPGVKTRLYVAVLRRGDEGDEPQRRTRFEEGRGY